MERGLEKVEYASRLMLCRRNFLLLFLFVFLLSFHLPKCRTYLTKSVLLHIPLDLNSFVVSAQFLSLSSCLSVSIYRISYKIPTVVYMHSLYRALSVKAYVHTYFSVHP